MSISPVSSITRASLRKPNDKLNILCAPTHARYESNLCKTGHSFFAFNHESFVPKWHTEHAPQPDNYIVFDKRLKEQQIPSYIDFDLVLSQNKFGQFQILSQIANQFHLPLISLEHTLPVPMWPKVTLVNCQNLRGAINVFITEYNRDKWGFKSEKDTAVINHGVDCELFCDLELKRENHILTICNDYIGRDWCCGWTQYRNVTQGLPIFPWGDTKGFSKAAESQEQLVEIYNRSRIFLNTAHVSPIPMSLLEAMACSCAVVSVNACAINTYIEHGVNGFLANSDSEMRKYLELLLKDEELAQKLGKSARQTILEKCSLGRFVNDWNKVLYKVTNNIIYRG